MAAANNLIALDEVLTSWQGDDGVQFVELRMTAAGQGGLDENGGAGLVVDDATASPGGQRVFLFTSPVTRAVEGARILVGTRALANLTNQEPDFVLGAGMLPRDAGRVCYVTAVQTSSAAVVDCVAWGKFLGADAGFGTPTPLTPDNRSLQRVALSGDNRADWQGNLTPTPETNRGAGFQLATLCGNAQVNQGEQCDGANLGGQDCTDFGFASGKLRCRQCYVDTAKCSLCGNGVLNGNEQCDSTELRDKTCAGLGFTGGTLACGQDCKLATTNCDPTFFVPGGGPPASDCLAEWRITNAAARPGGDGRTLVRQRCKDGDSGCDGDVADATCTFSVAVCLGREDARLARCRQASVESWTLLAPDAATDADLQTRLAGAVAGLGASSSADGAVIFTPALDATERCTDTVPVVVPTRGARPGVRLLKSRTGGAGGRPRDPDTLKLICVP